MKRKKCNTDENIDNPLQLDVTESIPNAPTPTGNDKTSKKYKLVKNMSSEKLKEQ